MKMPKEQFEALKSDCLAICEAYGVSAASIDTGGKAWKVFNVVAENRGYTDDHPGFRDGHWKRVLPCTYDFQATGKTYTDQFYKNGMHDAHIKTALAAIFPNAVFTSTYSY